MILEGIEINHIYPMDCVAGMKLLPTGGSVQAANVNGDVDAGGSVQCLIVGGDVDAGGSITMRQ